MKTDKKLENINQLFPSKRFRCAIPTDGETSNWELQLEPYNY